MTDLRDKGQRRRTTGQMETCDRGKRHDVRPRDCLKSKDDMALMNVSTSTLVRGECIFRGVCCIRVDVCCCLHSFTCRLHSLSLRRVLVLHSLVYLSTYWSPFFT
jgi:hypothetical protein